jgi:hypothetical protein
MKAKMEMPIRRQRRDMHAMHWQLTSNIYESFLSKP